MRSGTKSTDNYSGSVNGDGGIRWQSCLRYCIKNWKVAGSISDSLTYRNECQAARRLVRRPVNLATFPCQLSVSSTSLSLLDLYLNGYLSHVSCAYPTCL